LGYFLRRRLQLQRNDYGANILFWDFRDYQSWDINIDEVHTYIHKGELERPEKYVEMSNETLKFLESVIFLPT
jgi:hypothetical protein